MRLNKFIAHCGICSRRKAVDYIKQGEVKVNDVVEVLPYRLIQPSDIVKFREKVVRPEEDLYYILLNKPKNVICTMNDEQGRKSVMDILEAYKHVKLHYVGRLDRNSTGLLIMTNDGDLTQKLTHPSSEIRKIYSVTLDKEVRSEDMEALKKGVTLEDGFIQADKVDYDRTQGKNCIGIELHSGRNRIIRRMMEHLGYRVTHLDRVSFAGVTKKDLPRGWHRKLSEQEVIRLKYFTK